MPAGSSAVVHGALGRPSVEELTQQNVCAALLSTPGLDARHIEVEMTGSCVLLRGSVARANDRAWALGIAKRIASPRQAREVLTILPNPDTDAPEPSRRPLTQGGSRA
jgi:hypothetical protein